MNNNYKVYAHINKQNGKAYIGITNRPAPQRRWGLEGQGYKLQPKFYNAIQKYGWLEFEHCILVENLTKQEALDLETYYIEQYNSIENGYNVLLHGIDSYPRYKPVFCVTTQKKYNSIKEAALDTNTFPSRIIQNCKGQIGPVKGYQWTYWNQNLNRPDPIVPFISKSRPTTAIYCIEKKKFFNSVEEGAKAIGVNGSDLSKVLCKKRNGILGLHFIRASEISEQSIIETVQKKTGKQQKVYCYENNQVYNSLEDAASFCNKSAQSIMKNCQGKLQSCGGYHFSYIKDLQTETLLNLYYPINYQGGIVEDGQK